MARKGILGFCLCLGMTLAILACALPNENWWPMFEVVFCILAPLPIAAGVALTARTGAANDVFFKSQPQNTFFLDVGLFWSTALLFSGFALPFVFAHSKVISITALVLSICGQIIIYASIAGYVFFFLIKKKKEPEML